MILEAALSEKNEENASLLLLIKYGHAEVLLYPCLRYCKGGDCSSQVCCLLELLRLCLATESDINRRIRRRSRMW